MAPKMMTSRMPEMALRYWSVSWEARTVFWSGSGASGVDGLVMERVPMVDLMDFIDGVDFMGGLRG